jgi:aryl-alcohol dehydrogenase-like predicted oxidoreductase
MGKAICANVAEPRKCIEVAISAIILSPRTSQDDMQLVEGHATSVGTERARRRGSAHPDAYSGMQGLALSSVGLGTFLGDDSEGADRQYVEAILEAFRCGINLVDTARVYRQGRSERAVGAALAEAFEKGLMRREDVFVVTKAGYLNVPPSALQFDGRWMALIEEEYVRTGVLGWGDIANGRHCICPTFIEREVDLSRRALGLATIDLFLLHNPEEQLRGLGREVALRRIRDVFVLLERLCSTGVIRYYGVATWDGLRVPPSQVLEHLELSALVATAFEIGGEGHRFRAVQLPMNACLSQALTEKTQLVNGTMLCAIDAVQRHGLYLLTTRSLNRGVLDYSFSEAFYEASQDLVTDQQRLLQFVRSIPGVGTALIGTKRRSRAREAALVMRSPRLTEDQLALIIAEDE